MRSVPAAVLGMAAVVLLGCQGITKLDLTSGGRERWQRSDEVVAALGLRPGDRVADLGAGDGYFLPRLAEAVGPEGRVYAVEVDAELIPDLEARFAGDDGNVEVVHGEFADPQLPDGSLDVVLLVNTYHHIEDRTGYFARLRDDLDAGGRVAILEPNEDLRGLLSLFLDAGHTSRAADVRREMAEAGYRVEQEHDFLPVQIFQVYEPESPSPSPSPTGSRSDRSVP